MSENKPIIHEEKIVTQTPEPRKIPKIIWVLGAILLLFLVVGAGIWLANILTSVQTSPIILQ